MNKELKIGRNEDSAKLFSFVGIGKYFEELFTLILNGIVVSCWCVSFTLVVQDARLSDWLRRMQRNKAIRNEENQKQATFPEVKHKHDNPVASVGCTLIKKSVIYFKMRKQKAPISMLSRSKAPQTQQMAVTDT